MNIDFNAFLKTLPIMAKGMAGIFIVTIVIILAVVLLGVLTKPIKKKIGEGFRLSPIFRYFMISLSESIYLCA